MRAPVRIDGSAAGSTTPPSACRRHAPSARADHTIVGSTAAVPAAVAMRIGNTASVKPKATLEAAPSPNRIVIAGYSATFGIGNVTTTTGPSTRRRMPERPIRTPAATPTTSASANAPRMLRTVNSTSSPNVPATRSWRRRSMTSAGGGSTNALPSTSRSARTHHSAAVTTNGEARHTTQAATRVTGPPSAT